MEQIGTRIGEKDAAKKWMGLAEKVWASINQQFWYEEGGYLYDVVNGQERDAALRPNQILAVSLPFDSGDAGPRFANCRDYRRETSHPFGLPDTRSPGRTLCHALSRRLRARDAAYHQGTVIGRGSLARF